MDSAHYWMQKAWDQAEFAYQAGEVPVGAILVRDDQLLACASNQVISTIDPSAHAEVQVIRMAAQKSENYRLVGTTLYVTLEPCLMCFGVIAEARIARLFYGAVNQKCGVFTQLYREEGSYKRQAPHLKKVEGGVLAESCGAILKRFFYSKRNA